MAVQSFSDQMGHTVSLASPPKRIVSLVPSQTELLADLGLDAEVSGITKFCVHPPAWQSSKTIIGGTKNFRFDIIDAIKPDLIIGNKEENYREGIAQLRMMYPVWMSDIYTLPDAFAMITSLGEITGKADAARALVSRIQQAFKSVQKKPMRKVLYLIWRKPWMAAASDTFIHRMLNTIGLENCLAHRTRYPEITDDEIRALNPDCILLSSEPYPFQEKHIAGLKAIAPSSRVMLVDGEMFSWYGSRLAYAPAYFNSLVFE